MDKIYPAIFSQKDELKRMAMVAIINSKLLEAPFDVLSTLYKFVITQISSPPNFTDLQLCLTTLKVVQKNLTEKDPAGFMRLTKDVFNNKDEDGMLWVLEKVLMEMDPTPREDLLQFLKKGAFASFVIERGDSLPACLSVARFFTHDRVDIVTVLNWLISDHTKRTRVSFERCFVQLRKYTETVWEFEPDMIMETLKKVFELIMKTEKPEQTSALSLILMNDKTVNLAELACFHVVTNFPEIQVAEIMHKLSFWPMRSGLTEWFKQLFGALKEQSKKEGLYRITFLALENLVLQLFVPSCRAGAFEIVQLLLTGYQTEPSAFHSVLPALKHVLEYLEAEKKYVESKGKIATFAKPDSEFTSLACVDFILKNLDGPPNFDPCSPYNDLENVVQEKLEYDITNRLSRFAFDMMSLFTGFKTWYTPVMRLVRPHIEDDYTTDLKSLSLDSWTGTRRFEYGGKGSGSTAGHTAGQGFLNEIRKPGYGVGLNNLGNTCYLNSFLQALFHARVFRERIFNGVTKGNVHREIAKVFAGLMLCKRRSFSPQGFLKVIPEHYKLGEQQDVSEFAKHMFDAIERECKHEEICGKSVTVVCCSVCNAKTETTEPFSDLSLLFPDYPKEKTLSIEAMIEYALCRKELLNGDNQFKCNQCAKNVDATLFSEILESPTYLMVTLQRFRFIDGMNKKIMRNVKFGNQIKIVLRGRISVTYILFAVIFHSGSSSAYGHYYCYASESSTVDSEGNWELYNDSVVQKSSFAELAQINDFPLDTPYVLYYRRLDEDCDKRGEEVVSIPEELKKDVY